LERHIALPRLHHWLLPLLIALPALSAPLHGQGEPGSTGAGRGEELTIYLMTMGPGSMVWERFGHNAIWVRDEAAGTDIAYNYGMFSFEQDDFVLRFIRGHMDYWMEGFDAILTATAYMRDDRSVWAQELNLSPAQRAELRDFLEWNARPENTFYRYDYYRDNCSTRVRDAIDLVLGGQIRAQTEVRGSGTTYRRHTASLTADDLLIHTGLMAGLGQPVDREISLWEEMFLPMMFREHVRGITIDDGTGRRIPLVASEQEIFVGTRPETTPEPGSRAPLFLVVGLLLGGGIYFAGRASDRHRGARIAFATLGSLWALLAGTLGLVLLGLWALTDHATSYRNENLFFLTPLLLPLVALIPLSVGGSERVRRWAWWLAAVVVTSAALGLALRVLPIFHQQNVEIIALALPVNLALAAACRERVRLATRPGAPAAPPRTRGDGPRAARV
jgi:hypothetical protein